MDRQQLVLTYFREASKTVQLTSKILRLSGDKTTTIVNIKLCTGHNVFASDDIHCFITTKYQLGFGGSHFKHKMNVQKESEKVKKNTLKIGLQS
jgi:hypothetical protein